jgi:pimeloyl-ACP methyl ester carboxylesterase
LGESELGPADLTPVQEVDDIRRALTRLDMPGTKVVVGHSYGAMLALSHAAQYPAEVAGLVLVDPMNPRFVAEVGDWLYSTVPEIDEPRTKQEHAIVRMAATMDALSERLRILEPTLVLPMVIISAGQDWWGPAGIEAAWRRSHIDMAAAPQRSRIVADSSEHDIPASEPDLIVSAIARLVSESLAGTRSR